MQMIIISDGAKKEHMDPGEHERVTHLLFRWCRHERCGVAGFTLLAELDDNNQSLQSGVPGWRVLEGHGGQHNHFKHHGTTAIRGIGTCEIIIAQ